MKNEGNIEQESAHGNELGDDALEDVVQEMEESIIVPNETRKRQILLCPVGLVGAGKTTVVKPLSSRLGLVRVSTDEIRKRLKEKGDNYLRTSEIAKRLIENYLRAGHSVTIDADCVGSTRKAITELTSRSAITPVWIHINPPESFILNKLRTCKHTWLFKDAEEAVANYQRRKPLHETLDMPFLYTFDPSKEDLPKQIEEAARRIEGM
jgi:predicted kinase